LKSANSCHRWSGISKTLSTQASQNCASEEKSLP
jgi:hypothetical protein